MRHLLLFILLLLAFALLISLPVPLSAQSTTPVTATTEVPNNWVGTWASWNGKWGGGLSYATLVAAKAQLYSYTSYVQSVAPGRPFRLLTSTETGAAMLMRQLGPVSLFGFFQGGQVNNGTNATAAFSGGLLVMFRLGRTNWTIPVAVEPSTSGLVGQTQVYKVGVGRIW